MHPLIRIFERETRRSLGLFGLATLLGLVPFGLSWVVPSIDRDELAGAAAVVLTPALGLLVALRLGVTAAVGRSAEAQAAEHGASLRQLWLARLLTAFVVAAGAATLVALPSVAFLDWEAVEVLEILPPTLFGCFVAVLVANAAAAAWHLGAWWAVAAAAASAAALGLAFLSAGRLSAVGAVELGDAARAVACLGALAAALGATVVHFRILGHSARAAQRSAVIAGLAILAATGLLVAAGAHLVLAVDVSTLARIDEARQPAAGTWVLIRGSHLARHGFRPPVLLDTASRRSVALPEAAIAQPIWLDGRQAVWLEPASTAWRVRWVDLRSPLLRPRRTSILLPQPPQALAVSEDHRLVVLVPTEETPREFRNPRLPRDRRFRLVVFDLETGREAGAAWLDLGHDPLVSLDLAERRRVILYRHLSWTTGWRQEIDLESGRLSAAEEIEFPERVSWLSFDDLPGRPLHVGVSSSVGGVRWSRPLPAGGYVSQVSPWNAPLKLRFTVPQDGARRSRDVVFAGASAASLGPQLPSGEVVVAIRDRHPRVRRPEGLHRFAGWVVWSVDPRTGVAERLAHDRFPAAGPILLQPHAPLLLLDPAGGLKALDLETGNRRQVVQGRPLLARISSRCCDGAVVLLAHGWRRMADSLRQPLASIAP